MTNIFITGDRSMEPIAAVNFVHALLKDIVEIYGSDNVAIGTGNAEHGVERAVRYLIPADVLNILPYPTTDEGKPNFKAGFEVLKEQTNDVFFLHIDPLSSSIGRALAEVFPAESIRMPFQEVGMAAL